MISEDRLLHQCLDTDIIGYVFETSVQVHTLISMYMGAKPLRIK